jgi:hypothetical protein
MVWWRFGFHHVERQQYSSHSGLDTSGAPISGRPDVPLSSTCNCPKHYDHQYIYMYPRN